MYRNYQVVCNTAAGRRRYMQYLHPPIIASDLVDRYDIWINTKDPCEIEFFKQVAKKYSKVRLVWQPDGLVNGIKSINAFYKTCVEEDTIYVKLDDDIIWFEPDFFEKMLAFRVDNPDYFLVSPMVLNNAVCTYMMEVFEKIKLSHYMNARANHPILWKSPIFAFQLHKWFLENYLKTGRSNELHCGKIPIATNRFSINSILWFGSVMKQFNGIVTGDDEEFLSVIKPTQLKMSNCFNCDVLVSHFAFRPQRAYLDKTLILEEYGRLLQEEWRSKPEIYLIHQEIQAIMNEIKLNEAFLKSATPVYKEIKPTFQQNLKSEFKGVFRGLKLYLDLYREKKYILSTEGNDEKEV